MSDAPLPATVPPVKYARTATNIDDLFRRRWSPRSFSSRPVPPEVLETILDAGRWAASSNNEQPWRFVVGFRDSPDTYQGLFSSLMPGNQEWVKNVPVLMLTAARRNFSYNESPNYYALHDAGAALAYVMLQATASGLAAHAMGGFDREKARLAVGVPPDFEIGAMVAVGYRDSAEKLPAGKMRDQEMAPRVRKPLSELAFKGHWGVPLVK